MTTGKGTRIAGYIISGLLTLAFLAAGGGKLAADQMHVEGFARWGYPVWFMYLTGALEVACAIGLWISRTRALAALGLVGVMLGAIFTHLTHGEAAMVAPASVLLALATALSWMRRGELAVLLRLRDAQEKRAASVA